MNDWMDVWHPGVCAICNKVAVVAEFSPFDDPDAPGFYACSRCYLKRLDERR